MTIKTVKLVIIGDGNVGKTSMLLGFKDDKVPDPKVYVPTVCDNYSMKVIMDDHQPVNLNLWDTAGQETYDRLRILAYPGSHMFLIAFSVDMPSSLMNVKEKWYPEMQHYNKGTPFLLVGAKKDLRDNDEVRVRLEAKNETPVRYEEGEAMARKLGAIKYVECSSMTQEGIREVFEEVTRAVLAPPKKKCSSCRIL